MNCLSKLQHHDGSCYEVGHTWNASCSSATFEILMSCIKASLEIYTPIHLASGIFAHGTKLSPVKLVTAILQSTAFLSANAGFMVTFFCLLRRVIGKFYFLSAGLLPGIFCSFVSILIERKSRRGLLALYMFGVACETIFNMLVNHGMAGRVKYGEVYIFVFAVAFIMYFYRKGMLPDGIIKKIVRLLLNERRTVADSNNPQKEELDVKARQMKWIRQSAIVFGGGYAIHAAPAVVLGIGKWVLKPRLLLKILLDQRNFKFGAFLSSFVFLFKCSEYYLKAYRGKNSTNSLIAGSVAGLSFLFSKSSTIAVYFMSKVAEIIYKEISKQGYAPWFSSADVLLYAISTGIMFHAAVLEPHSLRPAYWNFLLKLTGGRFKDMNRKELDMFGCQSSKMYPDFEPFSKLKNS